MWSQFPGDTGCARRPPRSPLAGRARFSSLRARSSIQARYLLPEAAVSPANSAATTIANRNSSERGTVPASCHLAAAMTEPAPSSTGWRAGRESVTRWAATVYRRPAARRHPAGGSRAADWANDDGAGGQEDRGRVATAEVEHRDQRGLHDGRAVRPEAGPGKHAEHRPSRTAASSASPASGWVRVSACQAEQPAGDLVGWLLWRARRHRSQGRGGKPGHRARCASFVVAYRQRTRPRLRPEDEMGELEFVLREVPPAPGRGIAWRHAVW